MTEIERMEQLVKLIHDKVERMETGYNELRMAISGGDMTGRPGILQNQVKMINALFDEKEGVVPRLTSLERRELERMSFLRGANFIVGGVGLIIGWLLNHFVK